MISGEFAKLEQMRLFLHLQLRSFAYNSPFYFYGEGTVSKSDQVQFPDRETRK